MCFIRRTHLKSVCYWVEKSGPMSIPGYVKWCQIWLAILTSCWFQEKSCSWCLTLKNMKLWHQAELLITTCLVQPNHFPKAIKWIGQVSDSASEGVASSPSWSAHPCFHFPKSDPELPPKGDFPFGVCLSRDWKTDPNDEVYSLLEKGHLTMSLWRERVARMSSFISWCHSLEPVTSSWVW